MRYTRLPSRPATRPCGGSRSKTRSKGRPITHLPAARLALSLLVTLLGLAPSAHANAPTGVAWLPPAVQRHAALFEAAGEKHAIDPRLLAIMTWVESRGDPKVTSRAGARGLMQITPKTGRKIAKARGLRWRLWALSRPRTNLDYGAWYLKRQIERFGSVKLAVAAYNAGPGHVRAWLKGKRRLHPATRRYMNYVDALWRERDATVSKTLLRRRRGR